VNLGSSKKWTELLRSGDYVINDGCGLRWADNTFSPVGVLEDFITKTWKNDAPHSGCYSNKEGNTLIASKECLRKVKAKTNLEAVDDLAPSVDHICRFIETNYETL
jgi:hypothetical protein